MIIKDKEYGKFEVSLKDYGTLDTVLTVCHFAPNGFHLADAQDITFSQEYAADFRDTDGVLTDDGYNQLAQEAVEAYIEQYLI
jgi:hypothetical protein